MHRVAVDVGGATLGERRDASAGEKRRRLPRPGRGARLTPRRRPPRAGRSLAPSSPAASPSSARPSSPTSGRRPARPGPAGVPAGAGRRLPDRPPRLLRRRPRAGGRRRLGGGRRRAAGHHAERAQARRAPPTAAHPWLRVLMAHDEDTRTLLRQASAPLAGHAGLRAPGHPRAGPGPRPAPRRPAPRPRRAERDLRAAGLRSPRVHQHAPSAMERRLGGRCGCAVWIARSGGCVDPPCRRRVRAALALRPADAVGTRRPPRDVAVRRRARRPSRPRLLGHALPAATDNSSTRNAGAPLLEHFAPAFRPAAPWSSSRPRPGAHARKVVAEAIHKLGPRHAGDCVVLDCAAVPPTSSSPSSSATSAAPSPAHRHPHEGVFEQADGGTLFIDEESATSTLAPAQAPPRPQAGDRRCTASGRRPRSGGDLQASLHDAAPT